MKTKKHLSFTNLRVGMGKIFNKIPEHRQEAKLEISLHDTYMSALARMFGLVQSRVGATQTSTYFQQLSVNRF